MTRMIACRFLALAACAGAITLAQAQDDQFRAKILNVRYPPLAAIARVQGDVHLRIASGKVNLISGPPLLAQAAVENARSQLSIPDTTTIGMVYHFILIDPTDVPVSTTVKKGDAFDRVFLRMLGLKTEKVLLEYKCEEGTPPPNDARITEANIDIWIYGRGRCLMIETGTLLARN